MLTWIKILSIIFGVSNCQPADNTKCPTVTEKAVTLRDLGGNRYELELPNAAIIQRVSINTISCYPDRELLEKTHSLNYLDATDATMQDLVYSEVLYGSWGIDDNTIEIDLDPVIYTRDVVLTTESPVQCSKITLHGCETDEICAPGTCGNAGKCLGNGRCACARGFIGENCEMEVSKMAVDDFSFVAAPPIGNFVITKDAAFDVIGETLFNILSVSQPSLIGKRSGHGGHSDHGGHSEHGNSCTFHGSGGSCSYSSSHNSGSAHNGHSTYGHDPSHSPTSCMSGQTNGYSHTATVSAGHDHHHGESNYIYTTHGTSHNSPGCSLQYGNGNLDMHVHHEHEEHHGHGDHHYQDNHYHVTVPFTPEPGKPYTITSSFSPNQGACVYINGNLAGSQTKPTSTHNHPDPHQDPPQPHCFGKCGAQSTGNNNFTISNIAVAGGSVPTLTQNMLLGLMGPAMIQLLMQLQQKMLTTTAPTNSLQPLQVSSTLAPVTSSTPSSTTGLPSTTTTTSTQPPVTATTGHTPGNAATYGPVCFNCLRIATNGGCVNVTQCNVGDECLVFHDRDGYTHRCMSKTDCANGSHLSVSHCWNCCSDHYCNKQCIPPSTPPNQSGPSCQDDPQCAGLLNLGPYYDVCADPAYSSTICQKSCKICP